MRRRTRRRAAALGLAAVAVLAGCAPATGTGADTASDGHAPSGAAVIPPPEDTGFDYQLGGVSPPPEGTGIVVRDSTAQPAAGLYSVCYGNGFQTQPGAADAWGDLVLREEGEPVADEPVADEPVGDEATGRETDGGAADGQPVFDPDWPDEALLDTGTEDSRQRIADRLAPLVAGCAEAGFDAVEFDNLDSYTRSGGRLTLADNLALARLLSTEARDHGLAVAQKNTPEAVDAASDVFDFAIAEDCGAFDECGAYTQTYDVVLDIEYGTGDEFADLCAAGAVPSTAIRRELGLVPASAEGYVFERCDEG